VRIVEYVLSLLSPAGDELASVSAVAEPSPAGVLGALLAKLFEAAQMSAEPVQEAVEDALKALYGASQR
jgi:hypothetical protein